MSEHLPAEILARMIVLSEWASRLNERSAANNELTKLLREHRFAVVAELRRARAAAERRG